MSPPERTRIPEPILISKSLSLAALHIQLSPVLPFLADLRFMIPDVSTSSHLVSNQTRQSKEKIAPLPFLRSLRGRDRFVFYAVKVDRAHFLVLQNPIHDYHSANYLLSVSA